MYGHWLRAFLVYQQQQLEFLPTFLGHQAYQEAKGNEAISYRAKAKGIKPVDNHGRNPHSTPRSHRKSLAIP